MSTPVPVIVWKDGFENDPLGRQFTWGDNSFLYAGYAADVSANDPLLPLPNSYFEVTSDAIEGSHGLKGNNFGGTPISGNQVAHRFCLLISPANIYAPSLTQTDAFYVSWYMKFNQWQPPYDSIKIFHLGRYTTPTQRFILQANRGGSTVSLGVNGLFNNGQIYSRGGLYTLNLDTWYHFEAVVYESTAGGYYKLWINGTQVLNETGLDNVTGVDYGTSSWGAYTFEVGVEIAAGRLEVTGDVLFNIDDIQVGNIPIIHNLTINSTPLPVPINLDGVDMGNTPINMNVHEGPHTLQVPSEVNV